ncbi:uncharacterized protein LOC124276851 [Haliotis rubra]|uniref:uncharacterized protein LOC124276851 n=1 Tax=Haliotis rubra TaxID=36100 RepID=UPI001EE5A8D7|nr:uncharacterized protein LOC124276851 [Haliotis rubra]XP_046568458.1 uncharacterized protein LOC124276851 [Haliotis rubra]
MWQITSSMKTSSFGAKKRKASGERDLDVEIQDDDLGPSKQTQVMTSAEIKQEVCSTSSSNRAGTQVDSQFRDVSRGPSHADGIVLCGHCREMRATLCCMEKSCVSFAYRTWHMTSLFICDVCDITFHDNNPVMAEHLRSRLLIRNYNIESLSQKEATPVSLHENENSAPTLGPSETTCTGPLSLLQDTGTGTDAPRQQVQNTSVSAARLPGRQLSNILMRVHERYQTVLKHNLSHHCPLTETFRETKVARQTLVDAIGIAELKIVDPARYDEIIASYRHDVVAPRMLDVETVCRRVLNEYTDAINELRGKTIIPFRFNMYLPRGKPEQNS